MVLGLSRRKAASSLTRRLIIVSSRYPWKSLKMKKAFSRFSMTASSAAIGSRVISETFFFDWRSVPVGRRPRVLDQL